MNIDWLAQYHYIFVHFPIALMIVAGLAELLNWMKKSLDLYRTVDFLLIIGFLFLLPTIGTGLLLEDILRDESFEGLGIYDPLEWHERFAFASLAFAALTLLFRWWKGRQTLYYISLFSLVICVVVTAYFGGEMAFGPLTYFPGF